jgi:uncharacterized protein YlxW (UPF0749 family)
LSNKIIQSDNAVIDYTTISALINTVNAQQSAIENLQAAVNHTQLTVDPNTGQTTAASGTRLIHAGHVPITGTSVTVTFPSPFAKIPTSVVGTVLSTKGDAYAYVSKSVTTTGAVFTIVAKTAPNSKTTGMYLYYVAIGIGS